MNKLKVRFVGWERTLRNLLFASLVAATLTVATLSDAQQSLSAPFTVHQLTSNVYWVEGSGGISGIIVGDRGVVVFDTKTSTAAGKQLLDVVARITPKPVNAVILPRSDIDHVGGLVAFPKGISVIIHENAKKELEADPSNGGQGYIAPEDFPNRIVTKNQEDVEMDGVKLELLHWAPAPTSGDLVYVPPQKIVFDVDILCLDFYIPPIHQDKRGTSEGWIETVKGMLALDADRFMPGHGDAQSRQPIEERLRYAEAENAKIKEPFSQGQTLAQIQAAVGDPPPGYVARSGTPKFPAYSEVVYRELTAKMP